MSSRLVDVMKGPGAPERQLASGGGRPLPRPTSEEVGAVLSLTLVLGIPVLVAANPIDPFWQPGFYDDADPDQLVTHALSAESVDPPGHPMESCRRRFCFDHDHAARDRAASARAGRSPALL